MGDGWGNQQSTTDSKCDSQKLRSEWERFFIGGERLN